MKTIAVAGADLSAAWLSACRAMSGNPPVAYHTVVRIQDPATENLAIRAVVDEMLAAAGLQPVETVANTIFPAAVAASSRDHLELTRRYLAMLPTIQRLSAANASGTYFSRLVAFPSPDGKLNQLDALITRLRMETAKKGSGTGPLTACYEAGFTQPSADAAAFVPEHDMIAEAVPVRAPGNDTRLMGFPCLSHCSFQLDRSARLHAMAHYRSHLMVERAYGNYLGLGRLLGYVAKQAELVPGELTVTAGYARLDCRSLLSARLADFRADDAA